MHPYFGVRLSIHLHRLDFRVHVSVSFLWLSLLLWICSIFIHAWYFYPSLPLWRLHPQTWHLIFTLWRSKTDQFAVSCPIYIFGLNSFLSPYEPVFNYIQSRLSANAFSQDPLFITESGGQATRFWFSGNLHQVLFKLGISPDHHFAHSFE